MSKLPNALHLVRLIGARAIQGDIFSYDTDTVQADIQESMGWTREAFDAVLEAAAEVADNLLDAARDPWEIPGAIRKLKESHEDHEPPPRAEAGVPPAEG